MSTASRRVYAEDIGGFVSEAIGHAGFAESIVALVAL